MFGKDPFQVGVLRSHGAIGFLTNHDEPFFSTQYVHSFGAIRGDVEFFSGLCNSFPDGQAVPRRCSDFPGQLAGTRDTSDACWDTQAQGDVPEFHELETVCREVLGGGELRHDVAGSWSNNG